MTLTADRLEELEGLAEAATPGVWEAEMSPVHYTGMVRPTQNIYSDGISGRLVAGAEYWADEDGHDNAAFIAAFNPETAKELITAAREGAEAKAERDTLRQAKWEVKHTDTMNDMVLLGLARDSERERAERAESTLRSVQGQLEEAREALEFARDEAVRGQRDRPGDAWLVLIEERAARALSVQGEG